MPIRVTCECGKTLRVKDEYAGRSGRCPQCGKIVHIPMGEEDVYQFIEEPAGAPAGMPAPSPEETPQTPSETSDRDPQVAVATQAHAPIGAKKPAYQSALVASPAPSQRQRLYFILLLALLPLIWHTFAKSSDDFKSRLHATLQNHEDSLPQFTEGATLDDLLSALPDHKLDGALMAHDSKGHWGLAILSAGAFFVVLMLIFPAGSARARSLLLTGVFTGTLGILLLLGVQYAAMYSQGVWITGRGIVAILFYIVKFIGFSYRAALGDTGFVLSFLGFTCGVGFCEEVCKALPVFWRARQSDDLHWRTACLWGLASGIGFGISEGISYSGDFYNGIQSGSIYWVRFASCVALHAIWAASAAMMVYKRQDLVQGSMNIWEWLARCLRFCGIPMVLHGLYDTLLKKDVGAGALVVALVSFGFMAWQIEKLRREEEPAGAAPVAA